MKRRYAVILAVILAALTGSMQPNLNLGLTFSKVAQAASRIGSKPGLFTVKPDVFIPSTVNRTALGGLSPQNPVRFQNQNRVELPAKRTRFSRSFLTSDGYEDAVYTRPIHYQDGSGQWHQIDNTFVRDTNSGFAFRNRANAYTAELPSNIRAPIRFSSSGASIDFSLRGATGRGNAAGDTVNFRSILPGVSTSYQATADSLKESLILESAGAPSSFTFALSAAGVVARENVAGGIDFVNASGKVLFGFAPPLMFDAAGATSRAVSLKLGQDSSGQAVTLAADTAWLADEARWWPVTIDPTVSLSYDGISIVKTYSGANQDCYLENGSSSNTNLCLGKNLAVGYDGTNIYRSLLQFNISIPSDSIVLKADLAMDLTSDSIGASVPINLYQVTQAWTTSATWNTADGTTAWTTPGGSYAATAASTSSAGPTAGRYHSYLSQLVQGWVDGSITNNGLLVKSANETSSGKLVFRSSEDPNSNNWPYLKVTYQLAIGEQPWYKFQSRKLTDRMKIEAQVASGNLVLQQSLFSIHGTGLDENLDLFYNNLAPNIWDFGRSWVLNTGWDVWLRINDGDSVSLYGPSGWAAHFLRNSDGTFADAPGIDASLVQNANGTYTLTYHVTGEKYNFSSNGIYLLSDVDKNGNMVTFAYDTNGALSSITDTQGRVTTFSYSQGGSISCSAPTKSGFVSTITDPASRTHSFTYDSSCNLVSYTDPAGKVTQFSYDSNTDLVQITDPLGHQTKAAYDSRFRVTSITYVTNTSTGAGNTTTFTYNTGNTVVTEPGNHASTHYPDAKDRVVKSTDPAGNQTAVSYTADNHPTSVTDSAGGQTQYAYDTRNNLTKRTTATGSTVSRSFNDSGHPFSPTSVTDAQGNATSYAYDTPGNVVKVTDALGGVTTYVYNGNGTLASVTDPKGNTINYSYDAKGNLTSVSYPAPLGSVTYVYDLLSRLTSKTDGKGQKTTYSYDALDRATQVGFADSTSITYAYDADGNRTSMAEAIGTTSWSYDNLNRITSQAFPSGRSVSYTYDGNDNLLSKTDSGGTEQRSYNSLNQLISLTDPLGAVISFQYDSVGRITQIAYPNRVTEAFLYNSAGQILKIWATNSAGATLTSFTYTYTSPTTNQPSDLRYTVQDVAGNTTTYQYDALDRLTTASKVGTGGATLASYQYSYDAASNLTSKVVNGAATTFSYNSANQLTQAGSTTYSYDAVGNITGNSSGLSFGYNAENQTTSITPSGGTALTMSYSDTGQFRRITAGATSFQYDKTGLSMMVTGGATSYFSHSPDGAVLSERTSSGSYYYLHDALQSVVAISDSTGAIANSYDYDPYGGIVSASEKVTNPFRWLGAVWDATTQFYKLGTRYYAPDLGRFTQTDPLGSLNRYEYANDNPVNFSDTSGAYWCCSAWGWAAWWGFGWYVALWLSHTDIQYLWAGMLWVEPLVIIASTIIGAIIGGLPGATVGAFVGSVIAFILGVYVFWIIITDVNNGGWGAWVQAGGGGYWWCCWWWWAWVS